MSALSFASLKLQYQADLARMVVRPEHAAEVMAAAKKILASKDRYLAVVRGTIIPWYFVGITHWMEAGGDFTKHPHNGDPLTARTRQVPAGRPVAGMPPFPWEASARDCYIELKNLDDVPEWSDARFLYQLELFNGQGYLKYHPEVLSPYLYSMTNLYTKGKYVADGKFDPNAISKQVGAAALLLAIRALEDAKQPGTPVEPPKTDVNDPKPAPNAKGGLLAALALLVTGTVGYASAHPWMIGLTAVGALAAAGIVVYLIRRK